MAKAKPPASETVRRHHFMFTGEIIFREVGPANPPIQAYRVNTLIMGSSANLNHMMLNRASQALQVAFMKKDPEKIEIVEVVILNVVNLGHMTQEEFLRKPIGYELQEQMKEAEQNIKEAVEKAKAEPLKMVPNVDA